MRIYLVIFGAAVRPDGTPSGTLQRRVAGALAIGKQLDFICYMPTGGAGAGGHVEAEVMRQMLIDAGTPPEAIIVEPLARDTLQSVRLCDSLLRAQGDVAAVIPCTSPYHLPRCALLLRLLGWPVRIMKMPGDAGVLQWHKLIWYYLKEIIALPYDAVLLVFGRSGEKNVGNLKS
jgi:uncharacterized SAM-binding protein YcdF (DUF218 family)